MLTGFAARLAAMTDTTHQTTDQPTDQTGTTRYTGTFTIDTWEQHDEAHDGLTLSRARVTKTFGGDVVGTSRAELILAGTDGGSRAYAGFEQVTGTVRGRAGSFVLRHAAEGDAAGGWLTWTVLPGSGTGELAGLRGEGQITRHDDGSHSYWLELTAG
jgi:Protein of unknown function (DUF3224)